MIPLPVLAVVHAVTVVRRATVLEHANEGFLLRETKHATRVNGGVLRQVHVGVIPCVVRLAVAGLVGSGDREAPLAVRAKHGAAVIDVPVLDDVVLEVEAVRQHSTKTLLVHAVEKCRPTRVGVGQRQRVDVPNRVNEAVNERGLLVTIDGRRRDLTGFITGDVGHSELLSH